MFAGFISPLLLCSGQSAIGSRQSAVGSRQSAIGNRQWTVGSGQLNFQINQSINQSQIRKFTTHK